jgi:hypothetical protein
MCSFSTTPFTWTVAIVLNVAMIVLLLASVVLGLE